GINKVENQRYLFCQFVLTGKLTMSEACRQFQISRPTGYFWLDRYQKQGDLGLTNRSSKRINQSEKTSQEKEDCIVLLKSEYPYFGPKKLYAKLIERFPEEDWPQTTALHNILKKNGLIKSRKIRRRLAECNKNLQSSEGPNDIWCMDFKGWHMTEDHVKFDPFTITDHETRYLIRCNKLKANDKEHVWAILEMAFREYGLPLYIRSDNGPPFATSSPGRLSKLAIKLIKAGVTPEWIEPGNPQENGRHERMHLTMEQEGFVQGSSLKDQLKIIEKFTEYYNFERPHEALGQKTPGSLYTASPRIWSGKLNEIEYPSNYKVLRIKSCGKASWRSGEIYVSRVLEGEKVGVIEGENGFEMYYANILLGVVTEDLKLIVKRREDRIRTNKIA
ncbi:MAG: integrase core domain-containing protein, partial [Bacteroidota bacterium]